MLPDLQASSPKQPFPVLKAERLPQPKAGLGGHTRHRSPRWHWDVAVVAVATLATFARGIHGRLLLTWDDNRFIQDFEPIRSVSWSNLMAMWSEPHFQAFHPLHLMSYWLDVPLAGPDAAVIGIVNAGLWALALVLVCKCFRRLGLGPAAAVVATLAFGLHPVQVEAVTWATGRKEIVALLFASLAILAHLRSTGGFQDAWGWASRALFVLAALSKTTVLPLPGVLFLMDALLRGVPWRTALSRQVPALVLAAGFSVVVLGIWEDNRMIRPEFASAGVADRALLVLGTLSDQVSTALFPSRLSPVYPMQWPLDLGVLRIAAGMSFITAALVLAVRMRSASLAFAVLGFLLLLVPVLNIVPMYWLRADRYLSLPLLPLAFGLGALVNGAQKNRRARLAVTVGVSAVAVLAAGTIEHEAVYTSDARLWEHATRLYPQAYYAWLKLGETRRDAGDLDGAIRAYRRAVMLEPGLRLTNSALFYVTLLKDEHRAGFDSARSLHLSFCTSNETPWTDHVSIERRATLDRQSAWQAARCYHAALDDASRLRTLGGELVGAGYRDAVILVLERVLAIAPASTEQLENAASFQLRARRPWLAHFYLSHVGRPPLNLDRAQ